MTCSFQTENASIYLNIVIVYAILGKVRRFI